MFYLWSESAFVGLGEAGVMRAGYTPLYYSTLLMFKESNG